MTPRNRWDDFYRPAAPRRSVEGGVVVAKPGAVSDPLAVEMVDAAQVECEPQILARGRTYARAGQVVAVQVVAGQTGGPGFTAQIQGTAARPYEVRLDHKTISGTDRVAADCTCPYGCDDGWCKHAAALAYVAAFLLDRDPAARLAWSGRLEDAPPLPGPAQDPAGSASGGGGRPEVPRTIAGIAVVPASILRLDDEDLATLRSPITPRKAAALLAAAEALVPHPWSASPARAQADEGSEAPIDLRERGLDGP